MNRSMQVQDTSISTRNEHNLGLFYLGLNLIISVAAQLMLKSAMANLGGFPEDGQIFDYMAGMITMPVIAGLLFYGAGTIFWLLCLAKLDLSFAYPAGTLQYFLIFIGAWYFFDENISLLRIIGMLVIILGVLVMAKDFKKS